MVKSFAAEFKEFITKSSMIDLAVGIIIGAATTKLVNSLVNDIIMPPIGYVLGGVNFSDLYINLSGGDYNSLAEAQAAGAVTINYGAFLNTVIEFFIIGFVVFMLVKMVNKMREVTSPISLRSEKVVVVEEKSKSKNKKKAKKKK